jgi:hypothetical protein
VERLDRRDCEIRRITAAVLIGQIKLTRIHVLSLFLPGVRVKRDKEASLYDVERSGRGAFMRHNATKLALFFATYISVILVRLRFRYGATAFSRMACRAEATR